MFASCCWIDPVHKHNLVLKYVMDFQMFYVGETDIGHMITDPVFSSLCVVGGNISGGNVTGGAR